MIDASIPVEALNERNRGTIGEALGITFTKVTPEYLEATMPVHPATRQPLGLLHGGASAALAEHVGSMAAYLCIDRTKFYSLGLEIKCNHLRGKTEGIVTARAYPLHLGRKTHLWKIDIQDEEGRRVAFCTLTVMILPVRDLPQQRPPATF